MIVALTSARPHCRVQSDRTRGFENKGETEMAYEEREAEHRRIVVDTPTGRREEIHSEARQYPERSGVSGAALTAIVVGVIALAAIIILFVMNQQQNALNANTT